MTRIWTPIRPGSLPILGLCLLVSVGLFAPSSTAQRSALPQDNRQLSRQPAPRGTERRLALVIGNGAYRNVTLLKNPPNDATLLGATLRKLGFEVTVGTDRTQREMKQLIREFGQRLRGGGGVGLFYFAGHGVQARGHNYLIPVDAEIQTEADLEDVAVDVNYVLNMMDDAQNALNIAILDACRNNPFARSFRSANDGLAQVKAPTGTLIAYATSPDSVAADGGGANSPYAEELTKQIQVSGVLLETMFRRVAEQVSSRSGGRQEPWYSANVKGDFYFSGTTNLSLSNSGGATQPAKIDAVAVEREYWETIRSSNDPQDYKDYLQSYPNGAYAVVARAKIRQIETAKNSRPADSQPTNTQQSNSGGNKASEPAGAAKTSATPTGDPSVRYRWDSKLYRSSDGGQTWNAISPSLVRENSSTDVISAIAIDPSDPNTIYVGSSDGIIHGTHDAGRTWATLHSGLCQQICRIDALLIPKSRTTYLYAVFNSTIQSTDHGIVRTTNDGKTWEKVFYLGASYSIISLRSDEKRPEVLILQTTERRYQSEDWGSTWTGSSTDNTPGKTGSATSSLPVEETKLPTSVVVLASVVSQTMDEPAVGQFLIGEKRVAPNPSGTYRRGDAVGVYMQIDSDIDKATIEYWLLKDGKELGKQKEDAPVVSGARVIVARLIDTRGLAPGEYTIEIRYRASGKSLVKSAKFIIVP